MKSAGAEQVNAVRQSACQEAHTRRHAAQTRSGDLRRATTGKMADFTLYHAHRGVDQEEEEIVDESGRKEEDKHGK